LHCIPKILYAESLDTGLIIRARSLPFVKCVTYRQTLPLQTHHITDIYSIAVARLTAYYKSQ